MAQSSACDFSLPARQALAFSATDTISIGVPRNTHGSRRVAALVSSQPDPHDRRDVIGFADHQPARSNAERPFPYYLFSPSQLAKER
jgi:hypothetical protein